MIHQNLLTHAHNKKPFEMEFKYIVLRKQAFL